MKIRPMFYISSVVNDEGTIKVNWADGHTSRFHYIWLRDNCACDKCGAHASGSRHQSFLDIPEDIGPSTIKSNPTSLHVRWSNDAHDSTYSSTWLRNNCYSEKERALRGKKQTVWDGTLDKIPTVDYLVAKTNQSELHKLFASVSEFGFVLIRNVGAFREETERLANMIGYIRNTHFGLVTDLKLRSDPKHIADYPTHILPHSDETYRHVPTGINILHCMQPSEDGGGVSQLVDGHKVAAILRSEDPAAFDLLSKVPIQHERVTPGEIIRSHRPVFTVNYEGCVTEVRLNERTMSALSLPEDFIEPTYRALRKAFRIAYDPANCVEHKLAAGEVFAFDNLRVLHGRTGFAGGRLLRQTNVMSDEFYAKLAYLNESQLGSECI